MLCSIRKYEIYILQTKLTIISSLCIIKKKLITLKHTVLETIQFGFKIIFITIFIKNKIFHMIK